MNDRPDLRRFDPRAGHVVLVSICLLEILLEVGTNGRIHQEDPVDVVKSSLDIEALLGAMGLIRLTMGNLQELSIKITRGNMVR